MKVALTPSAHREIGEAASFYASSSGAALARSFIDEVERSLALLERHPEIGAPWERPYRRLPLRRFPYTIAYRLTTTEIRVLAVAHQRREPRYWTDRDR